MGTETPYLSGVFRFVARLHTLSTVSYTHLDVYKRQHRHCAVVEQIAVAHFIKRAVGVQKLHMALQALALGKAAHQLGGDLFLVGSQRGRIGREMCIRDRWGDKGTKSAS